MLPTVLLLPLGGTLWSAPAAGPLAAVAGAALAWPAMAGQATVMRTRAILAALGLWWCLLAEQAAGRTLLLGTLPTLPPADAWQESANVAARDVLWPLIASGAPLLSVPWAVAAAVLPLLVRGRSLAVDLVAVTGWATALAATTGAVAAALAWPGGRPDVRGAAAGALIGALIALLAAGARAPRSGADLP